MLMLLLYLLTKIKRIVGKLKRIFKRLEKINVINSEQDFCTTQPR